MSEQNGGIDPAKKKTVEPSPHDTRVLPQFPGVRDGFIPFPTTGHQLEYHRLALADPASRWWTPLLEGLLGSLIYLGLILTAGVTFALYTYGRSDSLADIGDLEVLQRGSLESPLFFLLMFMPVVTMWPALRLARLVFGPKPWGLIHSVTGRIRWGWLWACAAISLTFTCVALLVGVLAGESFAPATEVSPASLTLLLVLILAVVPLQCYAEELVFRGYLMQTLGRWVKAPAWAILVPAVFFMLGHPYDFWGQASILVMGISFGFLAWYTGGLEAGIAVHTVNNLQLMVMGVFGLADPFAQEGSHFTDFLWALILQGVLVLCIVYAARRVGLTRSQEYEVLVSLH